MKSNHLMISTRLSGLCDWRIRLLLAFFLIAFPSACRSKPHYVDLNWSAPSKSPLPIIGYNIYRSADGGVSFTTLNSTPIQETKYQDWAIQNGRAYRYQVKSVGPMPQRNESVPSNTVDVTVPK